MPSIGVISPYWSFWEAAAVTAAEEHRALLELCIADIRPIGAISWVSTDASRLHEQAPVDAFVLVVTMAHPPGPITTYLSEHSGPPVLIWAAHDTKDVPADFNHEKIVTRGATVGGAMLSASLRQAGVKHHLVLGAPSSVRVRNSLRALRSATTVRGSSITVIGDPIEGYDFMQPPSTELKRLGIRLKKLSPSELTASPQWLNNDDKSTVWGDISRSHTHELPEETLGVVTRQHMILSGLAAQHGSAAGTLNCHQPCVKSAMSDSEVAPCFALGIQTSQGIPWTCTGDVNTSLVMMMVASLGLPTFYHEIEAVDEETGEALLANSGEFDSRFPSVDEPLVAQNPWFDGVSPTPTLRFQIAPGPATLVALATVDDHLRLISAEGEFTSRPVTEVGTMSAAFRFGGQLPGIGWERWVMAGAGHHACATTGHIGEVLSQLAHYLEIDGRVASVWQQMGEQPP